MADPLDTNSTPDPEIQRAAALAARFAWLGYVNQLGAMLTSFWLLYVVFKSKGVLATVLAFVMIAVAVYPLGVAPMFAACSSVLSFFFGAVGVWLPIASYAAAAVALYVDLRLDRARRRSGLS